jgi:Tol biopolymer transport system component
MSWGIDNDLWIIKLDGTGAQRVFTTQAGQAALHPHFSDDGHTLIFSEREPTGHKLRGLARLIGPGGENPWDGWRIHIADFDISKSGAAMLSNNRTIQPNGGGFYETHEIRDGRIVYSHTDGGRPYVANVYTAKLDGSGERALTHGDGSWNEHGSYSPDGKRFTFMSSRFDSSWHYPGSKAKDLRTELYMETNGGDPVQITHMNDQLGKPVVVSDYDWNGSSTQIVMQVAALGSKAAPQIWLLTIQ